MAKNDKKTTKSDDSFRHSLGIGALTIPMEWLDKHEIPFNKDDLQRIRRDITDTTIGYRIKVKPDEGETIIKSIHITFEFLD